jgi:hypothetical protein
VNALARALLIVLAVGLVFGMGVHYESRYDDRWPYPDTDSLATGYESHVSEEVLLFGTVQSVDRGSATAQLEIEHATGTFEMTAQSFDADVRQGGVVQITGPLEPNHVIVTETVAVVNPAGSSTLYKYGVSLVGALLVTVAFFKQWRIDRETLSFEARYDG